MYCFDAHTDLLSAARAQGRDWSQRSEQGQSDLVRLGAGGVDATIFALFSAPEWGPAGALTRALEMIADFERVRRDRPDSVRLVTTADDLAADPREGELRVLLSLEGGDALCGSIGVLEGCFRLGLRALGLTWNHRNALADGVGEHDTGGGLTRFGVQVIDRMSRWGMMVDVSHLSQAGFWDVLERISGPLIASHSNARALCDHPRNLTDEQLRALSECGGVIGLNFAPYFLRKGAPASIEDVVRHADHIAEVAGPQAVGLGTDYDGIESTPEGLPSVEALPALVAALQAHGWDQQAITGLMGGNFRRVFCDVLP